MINPATCGRRAHNPPRVRALQSFSQDDPLSSHSLPLRIASVVPPHHLSSQAQVASWKSLVYGVCMPPHRLTVAHCNLPATSSVHASSSLHAQKYSHHPPCPLFTLSSANPPLSPFYQAAAMVSFPLRRNMSQRTGYAPQPLYDQVGSIPLLV